MALDYLPSPSWAVIYGETPSADRWSELGENDDALATGAGIDDLAILTRHLAAGGVTYAKLLSTIFSGQIQSYTNTGSGGGTCYYINLGGLKMAFGTSGAFNTVAGANYFASLPVGFFTTVYAGSMFNPSSSAVISQVGSNLTTSAIQQYIQTASTSVKIAFFVIGV